MVHKRNAIKCKFYSYSSKSFFAFPLSPFLFCCCRHIVHGYPLFKKMGMAKPHFIYKCSLNGAYY